MATKRGRSGFPVRYLGVYAFTAPRQRVIHRPYYNTFSSLVVMLAGTIRIGWEQDGRRQELRAGPGDVVYRVRGKSWEELNDPADPAHSVVVQFNWTGQALDLPLMVHDRKGIVRLLAETLLLAKSSPASQRQLMCEGYLWAMLLECLRLGGTLGQDLVSRVARYVEEHMNEPIRLDDLARHVELGKTYFIQRYKALAGYTPMEGVRRMKVEHARGTMALNPDWPLKVIAPRVGLADADQLSHLLKKYLGMTAGEIRRR